MTLLINHSCGNVGLGNSNPCPLYVTQVSLVQHLLSDHQSIEHLISIFLLWSCSSVAKCVPGKCKHRWEQKKKSPRRSEAGWRVDTNYLEELIAGRSFADLRVPWIDSNLILPLEFSPHCTKCQFTHPTALNEILEGDTWPIYFIHRRQTACQDRTKRSTCSSFRTRYSCNEERKGKPLI